ncbi:MAG TPA: hypothetical protein VEW46_04220 [Pyrinomonadaceae bacterium]|nr:hypothetical protein [Pyrinomonadaceae bacterium]
MSETIKQLPSQSRLTAAKSGKERSTILPFPQATSTFGEASNNGHKTAIPLIKDLCEALQREGISYCHWKSNWRLGRSLNGDSDLDLLVSGADAQRFAIAAFGLGFIQAAPARNEETTGIAHFYGWDSEAEKFVHLHVYYRLLLGHELTTNYHLPIEKLLLQSVRRVGLIPVPQPEFELIVFVLRKVLGFWTSEAIMRWLLAGPSEFEKMARELNYLEAHTDRATVHQLLGQLVPGLTVSFFERCLESLRFESSVWKRTIARLQLEKALAGHRRRHARADGILKLWRLLNDRLRERALGRRFANGGVLMALVGGDGAGKTTAVNSLRRWLDQDFAVRAFHFGKPRRSPLTLAVIIALRAWGLIRSTLNGFLGRLASEYSPDHPGYLHLVRWVCAARDRHRVYLKARRFANRGGIAICDRYLLPKIFLMDGPNIAQSLDCRELTWFSKALLKAENKYYGQIMQPDLLLILRVDPEIAVRRKTDENEHHVRTRSQEIWQTDWSDARACLVDAGQTPAKVLAELRALIWQQI